MRFTQRCGNHLEMVFCLHLPEDGLICLNIGIAAFNVTIRHKAKHLSRIFFIANANIHILHQRLHDNLGLLWCPEFFAIVQIAGYCHTMALCGLTCKQSQLRSFVRQGWCDAGPMEPDGIFKNGIKVKVSWIRGGNGRTSTVIDHFASTYRSTCFSIIDAKAVSASCNLVSMDTIAAQCIDSSLADFMAWHLGNKPGIIAIVGKRYGHISLSTAKDDVKLAGLQKTGMITRWRQAHHDLTKRYNLFAHVMPPVQDE